MSDSSDDNEYDFEKSLCGRKAFDVEVPDDFDPNIVPKNGIEYLQLGMYLARRLPRVASVYTIDGNMCQPKKHPKGYNFRTEERPLINVDSEIGYNLEPSNSENLNEIECKEYKKVPERMAYTLNWLLEKEADFCKLRDYIWCQYRYESYGHKGGPNCPIPCEELITTQLPTIEMLIDMSHRKMKDVLDIIITHLQKIAKHPGQTISYNVGMWIYILMAANFNYGDGLHCIKDIAKLLAEIRSKLKDDCSRDDYLIINVITGLVGHTFGQIDLCDNLEVAKEYRKLKG